MEGIDVEAYFAAPQAPPSRSRTRVSLVSLLGEAVGACVELCNGHPLPTSNTATPKDGTMAFHAFQHARKEVDALITAFKSEVPPLAVPPVRSPGKTGQVDILCAPLIQHNSRAQKPPSIENSRGISQQSALVVGARTERAREGVSIAERVSKDLSPCIHSRFRHAMHQHHRDAAQQAKAQWRMVHFLEAAAGLCEQVLTLWTDALLFAYSSDPLDMVARHHEAFQSWLAGRWRRLLVRWTGRRTVEA